MDKEELKDFLEEEFLDDPLMKQVKGHKLYDDLFENDLLENLNVQTTYSLSQTAEMLGVKVYTLRNFLRRYSLDEYIKPEKIGKLYRVDYRGVFKFHLIETLTEKAKKTPKDIANYLGTVQESGFVSRREGPSKKDVINDTNLSVNNQDLNRRLEIIERNMFLIKLEKQVDDYRFAYEQAKRSVIDWENRVALIGREIENLELQKLIMKQEKKTKDLIKESHKKIGGVNNNSTGFSLKNLFSKNKTTSIDYDKEITEAITQIEKQMTTYSPDQTIENSLENLKEQLAKLQSQKDSLLEERKKRESEYQDIKNKYMLAESQNQSLFNDGNEYLVEGEERKYKSES